MFRIRLLKDWSNNGTEYTSGQLLDIDNEDAVKDLVEKGIASRVDAEPAKVQVKAATESAVASPEPTIDANSFRTIVAEEIAKFAGETKRPHVAVGKNRQEDDPNKGYKNPREFIEEVLTVTPGKRVPERLKLLSIEGKTVQSDEHSTFADPYGGYLVPVTFTPEMLRIEPEADPTAGKTRMLPMKTPEVQFPARTDKDHSSSVSGGLTVTRREEVSQMTAARMEMEKVTLRAHTLYGLDACTEEVLTDSPISFATLLADGFRDEFTSHMIGEKLNGTGVGEYMGVLKSPCTVSIAKETGQAATSLVYENLVKMRAQCWGYKNAIWLANHDVLPQLMFINQTAGVAGNPTAWQPSAREDHPDTIFGRPLYLTEYCQTLGTVGDILCCNFREYLEGMLQPLQSAESVHLRFDYHERVFKFWLRNAGVPWWRTYLTPQNSTAYLSPFISLAVRA